MKNLILRSLLFVTLAAGVQAQTTVPEDTKEAIKQRHVDVNLREQGIL